LLNYYVLNRGDDDSIKLTEQFHQLAKASGMIENRATPDIVVSIGGDGTLLHAFHTYIDQWEKVSFVGVHTGHLGFFADWKSGEIEQLVHAMSNPNEGNKLRIVHYPLVEIVITTNTQSITYYALNEFTLKGEQGTLVAQLNINDEMFEMFRGDGICVSTPSGSTAYNKSLGGAVIHPSHESIQIAEIASINNRVFRTLGSSMILPSHHHCDIIPRSGQKLQLSIDHIHEDIIHVNNIRCSVSVRKASFARYRPFPFWTRVKDAFINNDNRSD
jgi:NAD+ kinase